MTAAPAPRQAPFRMVAHACGSRQFLLATASACLDVTTMPLIGTVTLTRERDGHVLVDEEPVQGEFSVFTAELTGGSLDLRASHLTVSINARKANDAFTFQVSSAAYLAP